jgi:hypothetical protein
MKIIVKLVLTGVFFTLVLAACQHTENEKKYVEIPVIKKMFTAADEKGTVLILSSGTKYKEVLRGDLVSSLNDHKLSIEIDDLDNYRAYNASEFDVVILLSSTQRFSPQKEATSFIKEFDYAEHIIYVSSYTDIAVPYGLSLKKSKIDAITAASDLENRYSVESVHKLILQKTLDITGLD